MSDPVKDTITEAMKRRLKKLEEAKKPDADEFVKAEPSAKIAGTN